MTLICSDLIAIDKSAYLAAQKKSTSILTAKSAGSIITRLLTNKSSAGSTTVCNQFEFCYSGISFPPFVRPSINPVAECDIFGPLCQTGSIAVGLDLTSVTKTTTVPCSYYLSAQYHSVHPQRFDQNVGVGDANYLSSFGRSPQCTR